MLNDQQAVVNSYLTTAWGEDLRNDRPLADRYGFTQRERDDESALRHYRARSYDPRLGRFGQRDPILGNRAIAPYTYADNDPISFIDPSGAQAQDPRTRTLDVRRKARQQAVDVVVKDLQTRSKRIEEITKLPAPTAGELAEASSLGEQVLRLKVEQQVRQHFNRYQTLNAFDFLKVEKVEQTLLAALRKIKTVRFDPAVGKRARAAYSVPGEELRLETLSPGPDYADTLIHELTHAATHQRLGAAAPKKRSDPGGKEFEQAAYYVEKLMTRLLDLAAAFEAHVEGAVAKPEGFESLSAQDVWKIIEKESPNFGATTEYGVPAIQARTWVKDSLDLEYDFPTFRSSYQALDVGGARKWRDATK